MVYQKDSTHGLVNLEISYQVGKAQWNSVILDDSISQGEIERMIDNSLNLVVSKMTKKDQKSILIHLQYFG